MVELVDTAVLEAVAERLESSSLSLGTIKINEIKLDFYVFFTYLYYVIKIKRYE